MKESRLYIKFFKEDLLILVIPAVVFAVAGYFYQKSQPTLYNLGSLYEINYSIENVSTKIALADEMVSLIRSRNLQDDLNIDSEVQVNAFKPGPLDIKVDVRSFSKNKLKPNLVKVENYLAGKAIANKIGKFELGESKPNVLLGAVVGLIIGFSLGLVVSLTTSYFEKF